MNNFFYLKKKRKEAAGTSRQRKVVQGKAQKNDVTLTWGERCWHGTGRALFGFPKALFTVTVWVWSIWLSWDDEAKSKAKGNPFFCFIQTFSLLSSLSTATTTIPPKLCYFFNLSTLRLRSFSACCSLSLSLSLENALQRWASSWLFISFYFLLSVELLNVICWG